MIIRDYNEILSTQNVHSLGVDMGIGKQSKILNKSQIEMVSNFFKIKKEWIKE